MNKRQFGLRTTYSVVFSAGGLSGEEAERRLFGLLASGGLARGVLLRNEGRLYLDVPGCPEYATPECGSVPGLVVHDKAGERILEGLLADAGQRLREEGVAGELSVFKASVEASADPAGGSHGGSYGCQEDYLVVRRGEFGRLADILIPFLVTRQLICGAGAVARTPRGTVFCLSRWVPPVRSGLSPTARRSRPLIRTFDEPHAAGLWRLRVNAGDSTMSETTTLLRAGATDLVLRMAEAGAASAVMPDLILDNPVEAMGEVSRDITGRGLLRLTGGRQLSALDIQREYLARARDFTDRHGADEVSGRVLRLWERALDAIGTGTLGAIAREIDWAIKYQLIERYRMAHDLPLSAPEVARADLAYHDVHRGRGLYYELQRGGAVERTARDIDIFEAKTVPPFPGRYRRAG